LEYCKTEGLHFIPAASYVNYGGLRASLPQGEITVGHIFELMPFENEIVLLELSANSIQQMANKIAGRGGEGVAGMKIGIRDQMAQTVMVSGKPLDSSTTYWLVTNDYVASGGDQMSMFINPVNAIYTRKKIRDIMIESLEKEFIIKGKIEVKEDGRIYHEK